MLLAIIATVMSVSNVVVAQSDSTSVNNNATKETPSFTLSGNIQTGTGYASLFGLKTSDKWSVFYSVDVQHKSGFGLGGYRMTDFQTEGLGRIAFFDLYWSVSLTKNLSLYAAMEYGFFDNNDQMSFYCPYIMVFWSNPVVNVDVSPMYCYYDRLKSDEITIRLRATKSLWKNGEVQLSGWYDNVLQKKLYGSVGITQQLPKNFYLQGDLLFRQGKTEPLLVLGCKF
jgi:hypothetical protein